MLRTTRNSERWSYHSNVSPTKKLLTKTETEIIYSEPFASSFHCFAEDELSLNLIMVMMVHSCLRSVKFQSWFALGVEPVIFFCALRRVMAHTTTEGRNIH